MQCSTNWLAEYISSSFDPIDLAARLSLAGLEATARPRYPEPPQGVIVGRITAVDKHPNADRLTICTVDTGAGETAVVCGAPNVKPGLVSPLAPPGAVLKGGFKLKKSKIRGVVSLGMLCAEDELGLSEDHTGLMELDPSLEPGQTLGSLIDFSDWLIEVDLTPNRVDCASVVGLAREAAAILGGRMNLPELNYTATGQSITDLAEVVVEDPDLCPRYSASLLTELKVKPSPWWMRDRLLSAGVRPISNLVDVTNYILLELNQPLHAFDFDRVAQGKIIVRRAKPGEMFTTLDGQERRMDEQMLMICDAERSVGIAGVMGGLNSEVVDSTNRVLIEAAYFTPSSIRRTSTRLGLSTEASYRFERGIDRTNTAGALERATALMQSLGEGVVHQGLIDVHPDPAPPLSLQLRAERCRQVLGADIPAQEMTDHLNSIAVEASLSADGRTVSATVPGWRPDLEREIDLVEEVARLHGYDQIPATFPEMREPALGLPPLEGLRQRMSALLAAAGLHQTVTYSFIPAQTPQVFGWAEDDERYNHLPLKNPITEDQSVLRTSLLQGLLSTLAANSRRQVESIRIFEWGRVFFPTEPNRLPREETRLGGLIAGPGLPQGWNSEPRDIDFYDLKGLVERLIRVVTPRPTVCRPVEGPEFLAGQAAEIEADGLVIGRLGQLAPRLLERFKVKEAVFAFDLSADALAELDGRERPKFVPLPKFPSISRDLALVVDRAISAGQILAWAGELDDPTIEQTAIFDYYDGLPLADNEKSIGLRVRYRSTEKTLTEEEIGPLHQKLTEHLINRTGGKLRQ